MIEYNLFFKTWKCWEKFEKRRDEINGVYAFRLKYKFGRVIGESDILYFGACNQNANGNSRPGLWHRLQNYRQNNGGASKRLKDLEGKIGGKCNLEYSYIICDRPRDVEIMLLQSYFAEHFEYPPLNRCS